MNKKFDDDMLAKICEMVGKNTIEELNKIYGEGFINY